MVRTEAIIPLALAIGAATGIVSSLPLPYVPATVMRHLPEFAQGLLEWVVFFSPMGSDLRWQAPYAFGAGIFTLLTLFGDIDRRRALLILPTSIVAWNVLWIIALAIVVVLGAGLSTDSIAAIQRIFVTYGGFAGGLTGASLTAAGLCWMSKRFRNRASVMTITVTGTLAGSLLAMIHDAYALRPYEHEIMFVIWQTWVAAAIAWRLSRRRHEIGESRPDVQMD